jgi:hypothetical protein
MVGHNLWSYLHGNDLIHGELEQRAVWATIHLQTPTIQRRARVEVVHIDRGRQLRAVQGSIVSRCTREAETE